VGRTPTTRRKRTPAAGGTARDPPPGFEPCEAAEGATSVQAPGVDPVGTEGVADPVEGFAPLAFGPEGPVLRGGVEGTVVLGGETVDAGLVTDTVGVVTVAVGFVPAGVVTVADGVVAVVTGVVTVVEGTVTVVVGTVTVGVVTVVTGVVTVVEGTVTVGSVIVPGAAVAVPPANIVCASPKPAAERATAIAGTRINLNTPGKRARRMVLPLVAPPPAYHHPQRLPRNPPIVEDSSTRGQARPRMAPSVASTSSGEFSRPGASRA
jgi:hypothetical protein